MGKYTIDKKYKTYAAFHKAFEKAKKKYGASKISWHGSDRGYVITMPKK